MVQVISGSKTSGRKTSGSKTSVGKTGAYPAMFAVMLSATCLLPGLANSKLGVSKVATDTVKVGTAKTTKTAAQVQVKSEGNIISDCEPVSDLVAPGQKLRVRKDRSAFIKPENQLSGVVSAPPDVIMDEKHTAKQTTEIAMQTKFRQVHSDMPQVVSPRTSLAGLNRKPL